MDADEIAGSSHFRYLSELLGEDFEDKVHYSFYNNLKNLATICDNIAVSLDIT